MVKRDQGTLLNTLRDNAGQHGFAPVHLEDPVFEKKFEVYTTDQIEARYLLTTSFMQRLLDMSTLLEDTKIECSFYKNHVIIKVPTSKIKFEITSVFKPVSFEREAKKILKEMTLVFKMIDALKLYEETRL